MKIQNKKIDDLNYKLTLELVKEDYAEKKRKMLEYAEIVSIQPEVKLTSFLTIRTIVPEVS